MKNFIRNLLIVLYAIIAIFITVCLISYNDQRVTVFGDTSLVIIDNKDLEPNYNKNDLVLVSSEPKVAIGDEVFFYNTYESKDSISVAKITAAEKITETETTYTLEGEKALSSQFVIGKAQSSTKIPVIGLILKILESKWGYLFLIVLPSLLAFLYEVIEVIKEIKNSKEDKTETKNENKEEK